jgi:MoxR-like ATPase
MAERQDAAAPGSPAAVAELLRSRAYLADRGLATAVYLALTLDQPLLLEGEAGVGKTEVARTLAAALGRQLVRLQCYEGIDASQALYEWDYPRQLLHLRAVTDTAAGDRDAADGAVDDLFGPRFLLERPLLAALRRGDGAVLLIDEVDRADDEFEAFLLEILSDFQITIPEVGTIAAARPPLVVLTSNRTRELHDALKRRCLYHWIGYPELEREVAIVRLRAPGLPEPLVREVVAIVGRLRELDLAKAPGVAETINWARALGLLGVDRLDPEAVEPTLGSVLKDRDDLFRVHAGLQELLAHGAR